MTNISSVSSCLISLLLMGCIQNNIDSKAKQKNDRASNIRMEYSVINQAIDQISDSSTFFNWKCRLCKSTANDSTYNAMDFKQEYGNNVFEEVLNYFDTLSSGHGRNILFYAVEFYWINDSFETYDSLPKRYLDCNKINHPEHAIVVNKLGSLSAHAAVTPIKVTFSRVLFSENNKKARFVVKIRRGIKDIRSILVILEYRNGSWVIVRQMG